MDCQVTYAARDSDFDGHQIHQGDYLAMYNKAGPERQRLRGLEQVRDTGRGNDFYGADITEKQASKAAGIFSSRKSPMPMSTCSAASRCTTT